MIRHQCDTCGSLCDDDGPVADEPLYDALVKLRAAKLRAEALRVALERAMAWTSRDGYSPAAHALFVDALRADDEKRREVAG